MSLKKEELYLLISEIYMKQIISIQNMFIECIYIQKNMLGKCVRVYFVICLKNFYYSLIRKNEHLITIVLFSYCLFLLFK